MVKQKKAFIYDKGGFYDLGMPVENLVVVPRTKKYLWGLWSRSDADLYFTSDTKIYRLDKILQPTNSNTGEE